MNGTQTQEDSTMTRTYKLQRKSETDEWAVVAYDDGKRNEEATYYTNDKKDAEKTLAFNQKAEKRLESIQQAKAQQQAVILPEIKAGDNLTTVSGRKVQVVNATGAKARRVERAAAHEERRFRLVYLESGIKGNGTWTQETLQAAGFKLA
jgi:hypothetical protein